MDNEPPFPVIYSIINPYDTVHYVRVQKTFKINVKEDWSTLNSDSMQFHEAEVYIHGKDGDQIPWTVQLYPTAMEKEDGFFPTTGYTVYKLDHPLPITRSEPIGDQDFGIPDIDSLILEVKVPDLNLNTKATAPVLRAYKLQTLPSSKLINLHGTTTTKFSLPGGGEDCDPSKEFCYRQIEFKVHYKDNYEASYGSNEISWMTTEGWNETESSYPLTPERLFNRMRLLLPKSNDVVYRTLDSIDVTIIKPSKCSSDWWQVREYWENSDNPPLTNFDHSYGLFITYLIG
jgi:hypothetical protein